jgi:membrane associated rhomboid family serine protease
MRPTRRLGQALSFGGRIPAAVGALVAVMVVASLAGVVGARNGLPLLSLGVLSPPAVLEGEVWRLVTWVFLEAAPLDLLLGCYIVWWLGRDLAFAWGEKRFLGAWLGLAAGAAALTCLASLGWPAVALARYAGPWPVVDALIVAWALLFPERQILLFFALPVSGRSLLWFTLGGTALFAAFGGVAAYVPHLAAEALALAYLRVRPGLWFRRLRFRPLARFRRGRGRFEVIEADRDPDRHGPRWLN